MNDYQLLIQILGFIVVAMPVLLVATMGVVTLLGLPLSERLVSGLVQVAIVVGLIASLGNLGFMLALGTRHIPIEIGEWVHLHHEHPAAEKHEDAKPADDNHAHAAEASDANHSDAHVTATEYHFSIKFVFDRLSVPFVVLTYLLCGTISAFANRYMHREPGYTRFFILYSFFLMGMIVTSLAGTIETLFFGWELVGLSSAMLVAFFHDRAAPVRNGLWVWAVYRVSDAALLLASVVMHHLSGHGDFDKLLGSGPWPMGHCAVSGNQALLVGILLLAAAAGKSALIPFSGWLPRAMEGPTPSSAVFYGALSVHLGAFLLLRVSPLLDVSFTCNMLLVAGGLVTAAYASLAGRAQTDVKSALSFASLAQVGIIVAEIGLGYFHVGLRYFALVHILGHACFRTLQFIRAPSLLYDYSNMENAIGNRLPRLTSQWHQAVPSAWAVWLYRLGLEKGFIDCLLVDYVVSPFVKFFEACDRAERAWTNMLAGGAVEPAPAPTEVLAESYQQVADEVSA